MAIDLERKLIQMVCCYHFEEDDYNGVILIQCSGSTMMLKS